MKYEPPELTTLTSAIKAIQNSSTKYVPPHLESNFPESGAAYQDYEE